MARTVRGGDRGISPVTGAILLVGIVVVLGAVTATLLFGATDPGATAPRVTLELQEVQGGVGYRLVHRGGDTLDGDKVRIKGGNNPRSLFGRNFSGGSSVRVFPAEKTIEVVWKGGGSSYVLDSYQIEGPTVTVDKGCEWVKKQTNDGKTDVAISGITVGCSVVTEGEVLVENGGEVLGRVESEKNRVRVESGGTVRGDVTSATGVVVDGGRVRGQVRSDAGADVSDGKIEGRLRAKGDVQVSKGSTVEGSVTSDTGQVSVEGYSYVVGDVTAEKAVEVAGGQVGGSITSKSGSVTLLSGGTVGGSVTAESGVSLQSFSRVDRDVLSKTGGVTVYTSEVGGSVTAESGSVELDAATVTGDVYVSGSFLCTASTIGGVPCSRYSPKSP